MTTKSARTRGGGSISGSIRRSAGGWVLGRGRAPARAFRLSRTTHAARNRPPTFWMIEVRIFSEPASDRCV
jgi:hypothetical protein